MNDYMITWPPAYQVRKHRLAKRVKLVASKKKGLVISAPLKFSHKHIPFLLEENKTWILTQLAKWEDIKNVGLPEHIHFLAANEKWKIYYEKMHSKKLQLLLRPQHELVVLSNDPTSDLIKQLLVVWIKKQATNFLQTELSQLSERIQLPFQRLSIRDQQTRWGSCNAEKNISLNYKLIFLPPYLLNHILIHELCHTIYLNHSSAFWRLVSKYDPCYEDHHLQMRNADQYVPQWLF